MPARRAGVIDIRINILQHGFNISTTSFGTGLADPHEQVIFGIQAAIAVCELPGFGDSAGPQ